MLLLDIAAIIAMMLLGTYCSFTDCKKGIVSNMAVKTGLGVAIALLVMRTVIGGTGQLASCAANVSITCLFSIALYATHTWAGGDCKLACAMAFLYPSSLYLALWELLPTLPLAVLIALALGTACLLASLLKRTFRKTSRPSTAEVVEMAKQTVVTYVSALACIAAIGIPFNTLVPDFTGRWVLLGAVDFCAVWFLVSRKILRNRTVIVCLIAFDIIASFILGTIPIGTNPMRYVLILALSFMRRITISQNYRQIPTSEVGRGTILSTPTSLLFMQSRIKGLPGISDETVRSRLTEDEAASVRRWANSSRGEKTVSIVRKVPFAIYILLGFVTYLIAGVVSHVI